MDTLFLFGVELGLVADDSTLWIVASRHPRATAHAHKAHRERLRPGA
jgi:hypothetical protein